METNMRFRGKCIQPRVRIGPCNRGVNEGFEAVRQRLSNSDPNSLSTLY